MRLLTTSVTVVAAAGLALGVVTTGSACEWMKSHVTASATPATEEAAAPATSIDPLVVAKLEKAVILPSTPTEEAIEDEKAE